MLAQGGDGELTTSRYCGVHYEGCGRLAVAVFAAGSCPTWRLFLSYDSPVKVGNLGFLSIGPGLATFLK